MVTIAVPTSTSLKGLGRTRQRLSRWKVLVFKFHLVVNECAELLAICLTSANGHELKTLSSLVKRLFGKLFGDMAYLTQLVFQDLMQKAFISIYI